MPSKRRTPGFNRLLNVLPERDRRDMLDGCESVELGFIDVLCAPELTMAHACFTTASFISLIMPVDAMSSLEVGLIGDEGMGGISLALGVDGSPMRAMAT